MLSPEPLSQRAITELLSIREFLGLCGAMDERCGRTLAAVTALGGPLTGMGGGQYQIAARNLGGVRFDVLHVDRDEGGKLVSVLVSAEDDGLLRINYENGELK